MTLRVGHKEPDWTRKLTGDLRLFTLAKLVKTEAKARKTEGVIMTMIATSNQERCEPPLTEDQLKAVFERGWAEAEADVQVVRPNGPGDLVRPGPDLVPKVDEEVPGWLPQDIRYLLDPELQLRPVPPVLLTRKDGKKLLYPGRTHFLFGPPTSAKSWIAQVAAVEVLRAGGKVAYLDFEAEAVEIVGRLLLLGATRDQLGAGLFYSHPEVSAFYEKGDFWAYYELLKKLEPKLIVIDGFFTAMVSSGMEPVKNSDLVGYWEFVIRRFARTCPEGPLVVIDHIGKEDRGPIGASQKTARVSGASLQCIVVESLARGKTGVIKLVIYKDRPGALGRAGEEIAQFEFTSSSDGTEVAYKLEPPPGFRPTTLMVKVSAFVILADNGGRLPSTNQIVEARLGRKEWVKVAIQILVEEGYLAEEPGPRNARLYRSLRPFIEQQQTASELAAEEMELPGVKS